MSKQFRHNRKNVNGWILLDKPLGLTSTRAVAIIKRLFNAKKVGHAGTLDPLASGMLPIALGEATKTIPFIQDGKKTYEFTVKWGEQTSTDDAEGEVLEQSSVRPTAETLREILPQFTGDIEQVPPPFSAIMVDGKRAYDLARSGEKFELAARIVHIEEISVLSSNKEQAELRVLCGKGTYIRSLARDLALAMGTRGHVTRLRRLAVGHFSAAQMVSLANIELGETDSSVLERSLLPVEEGLKALPRISVDPDLSARLRSGNPVLLTGRDAPIDLPECYVLSKGRLVAVGFVLGGHLHPRRVFNLG